MARRFIFDHMARALKEVVFPSRATPGFKQAPMLNSPKQAVTTQPIERQPIDYSQALPVLELVAAMHNREAVKLIPVKNRTFVPIAPHAEIGPARADIPDQRLAQWYPDNLARASYIYGAMSAPARLQSVPGYTVVQTQRDYRSSGYPTAALKAPRPNSGGGQCKDNG